MLQNRLVHIGEDLHKTNSKTLNNMKGRTGHDASELVAEEDD